MFHDCTLNPNGEELHENPEGVDAETCAVREEGRSLGDLGNL